MDVCKCCRQQGIPPWDLKSIPLSQRRPTETLPDRERAAAWNGCNPDGTFNHAGTHAGLPPQGGNYAGTNYAGGNYAGNHGNPAGSNHAGGNYGGNYAGGTSGGNSAGHNYDIDQGATGPPPAPPVVNLPPTEAQLIVMYDEMQLCTF